MTKEEFIAQRKNISKNYFKNGFNCAQSVVLAFADILKLEEKTLLNLSSPFGGGMGQLREVCGAVSGMLLAEGLLFGYSSPADAEDKKRVYAETRSLAEKFKETNKSIICRELLSGTPYNTDGIPAQRTEEYYKKRPCADIVEVAAGILAEYVYEKIYI